LGAGDVGAASLAKTGRRRTTVVAAWVLQQPILSSTQCPFLLAWDNNNYMQ